VRSSAVVRVTVSTVLLAALTSCDAQQPPPPGQPQAPSVRPVPPNPAVGAVFLGTPWVHTCSAAVLDADADLILTAAHCLTGNIGATFVAGFDDDAADEDVWHIDAVYLDQRWVRGQDPQADYAIARVSRDAAGSLRSQAGGGLVLGHAPQSGAVVTVTGYEMGIGGRPASCTAGTTQETRGFPSLPCAGLVDGYSGAPWLIGSTVTGLVGGLDGGGCDENVSYSPRFDDAVQRMRARAEAGGPGDDAPAVFDDDCG
jgi:Trypsin-like peptidase domain